MSAVSKIKVLLVDDHALLREGLRSMFEGCEDIQIVGEAGSARELLPLMARHAPDVVLLDIKLLDANGVHLIPIIKAASPSTRVIMMTMFDHARYATNAFAAGADGFIVKGAPFEELVLAVHEAVRGKKYVCKSLANKVAPGKVDVRSMGPLHDLSEREFEVLLLMGEGLSVKQVAAQIKVHQKTASTYRGRLMEKLDLKTNADIVRFVIENHLAQ